MAIGAINNSANVSFKGIDNMSREDVENLCKSTRDLGEMVDTFTPANKKNKKKNPIEIMASLATALLISYAGARKGAETLMNAFPTATTKLTGALQKAGNLAMNATQTLEKNEKPVIKKGGEVAETILNHAKTAITGSKQGEEALNEGVKRLAGAAGAFMFTKGLSEVDADGNGEKDITEKGKNAYEGFIKTSETISSISNLLA